MALFSRGKTIGGVRIDSGKLREYNRRPQATYDQVIERARLAFIQGRLGMTFGQLAEISCEREGYTWDDLDGDEKIDRMQIGMLDVAYLQGIGIQKWHALHEVRFPDGHDEGLAAFQLTLEDSCRQRLQAMEALTKYTAMVAVGNGDFSTAEIQAANSEARHATERANELEPALKQVMSMMSQNLTRYWQAFDDGLGREFEAARLTDWGAERRATEDHLRSMGIDPRTF